VPLHALPEVGVPLGILMGAFSGLLALLFLHTLQNFQLRPRHVLWLITQFFGIPALWLSVPFGSKALAGVRPERLLTSYIISLAAVWMALVSIPLIKLAIATGNDIGRDDE
jgi:hypothetical protein